MTHAEDGQTVGVSGDGEQVPEQGDSDVTAHSCSPDRTVFTEKDNTDAWIATDLTVDLER